MARTIGRHWPKDAPRGDFAATCDDCGVRYRFSQLRRMPSGLLRCEGPGTNDCSHGREVGELDEANARSYQTRSRTPQQEPAAFDSEDYTLTDTLTSRISRTP